MDWGTTRCPQSSQTSYLLKCFFRSYFGSHCKQKETKNGIFGFAGLHWQCPSSFFITNSWGYYLISLGGSKWILGCLKRLLDSKLPEVITWFLFMLHMDPRWRSVLVISLTESLGERSFCSPFFKDISGDRWFSPIPEKTAGLTY